MPTQACVARGRSVCLSDSFLFYCPTGLFFECLRCLCSSIATFPSIYFQIATPSVGDIVTDTVTQDEVKVETDPTTDVAGIPISTAQKVWVPFTLTVPMDKTIEMSVSC
jgi:hypothetical protein